MRWAGRLALVAALTVGGLVGLRELADATRNTGDRHVGGTISEIVLDVRTRRRPPLLSARGLWGTCHLQIPAIDLVEPARHVGGDRYVVVVTPALGDNDRRRLTGCLQDGTIDRVWADVAEIRDGTAGDAASRGTG